MIGPRPHLLPRLAPLLLLCACSSTATSVDTFSGPEEATAGIVAAVSGGDLVEAERIFGTYARSSVLRDSVFRALAEAASAAQGAGDAAAARRLAEYAQVNFPGAGYATVEDLEAALGGGGDAAQEVEEAAAAAARARQAQEPLEATDWKALEDTRAAIEAGDLPRARARFEVFVRTWDGAPADLRPEIDRIQQLLSSN